MLLSERYRTALVTGASSGLGAAFTEMLLREGVSVWGTSRKPEQMRTRERFHPVFLELSDSSSIDKDWASIEESSGGIDLLINNAGSGIFSPFEGIAKEDWETQIDVLLLGPVRLARRALGRMASNDRGCIVFVTSLSVEFPIPYMTAYDAGKAGLSSFADSFGLEVGESGVLVMDFRPGDYQTGFNRAMNVEKSTAPTDPQVARMWDRMETLMRRAPVPDVAACDLRRALIRGRSGVVRSGSFFQTRIAPFLNRLVPEAVSRWARRRYFQFG